MKYFLDTNICIYYLKGIFPGVRERLLSERPENIRIPSIVKAELLLGVEKSLRREENLEALSRFLFPLEISGFGDAEASAYARIRADLEKAGKPIGPNDLIIAATVRARDGILVTHNTDEFSRVEGLRIEDWTV